MTKNEWFKSFQRELGSLSFDEQQRAIDYYRELYADKAESGMRENDIIKSFGSPALAAQEILQNGVNYNEDDKDEAPMPEIDQSVDQFAGLVKRTIGVMLLLFADSVVFSIFWNLIKVPGYGLVKAILAIDVPGILMCLGATLILVGIAILSMTGLIKSTIKCVLKLIRKEK